MSRKYYKATTAVSFTPCAYMLRQ